MTDRKPARHGGAKTVGGTPESPARVAFVMEQHLGHRTYAENLRTAVKTWNDVEVTWIPVEYAPKNSWWERVPSDSLRGALRGRAEVGAGLRRIDADVVVFNTQVPAVLGGRVARSRPYVLCTDVTPVQYDDMAAGYQHRADRPGPGRWLKHRWNRYVFDRAVAHAPWSSWVKDSLIGDYGVDPARIEVIPPGVDTDLWQPGTHDSDIMRILFVGGDFDRKGGALLLRAFDALGPDAAELRIVTRSSVPRQPGVRVFNGLSPGDPQLRELYRSSDVFVLPSGSETFGIAAVEAAAAGLPVVATRVGGLGDLVVDEETGFTMAAGDADGLTTILRRFLDDPQLRRTMGRAARRRAELEFDSGKNADRLLRLILGCLDGQPSGSSTRAVGGRGGAFRSVFDSSRRT